MWVYKFILVVPCFFAVCLNAKVIKFYEIKDSKTCCAATKKVMARVNKNYKKELDQVRNKSHFKMIDCYRLQLIQEHYELHIKPTMDSLERFQSQDNIGCAMVGTDQWSSQKEILKTHFLALEKVSNIKIKIKKK